MGFNIPPLAVFGFTRKFKYVKNSRLSTMDTLDQKLITGKADPSGSFSSTAGFSSVGWTPEEEQALVRKFDWRILPGLSILYLLCFLDRA